MLRKRNPNSGSVTWRWESAGPAIPQDPWLKVIGLLKVVGRQVVTERGFRSDQGGSVQTGPVCITQRWSAVDKSVCSSARLELILSSQCLPAPRPQRSSFPNPKERPRLPRKPMRDGTVNSWGTSRSHFGDCFTNGIAGCDTSRMPSNASG